MMPPTHRTKLRRRLGLVLLGGLVLAALAAPWIAPSDPLKIDMAHRLCPPGKAYALGTDQLGRCTFSRVLYGARISLAGACTASLLAMAAGCVLGFGAAAGQGGWGRILTGFIDLGLALPGLILTLVISGIAGGSMGGLVLGLALANWPWWARMIQAMAGIALEKEFVLAGRAAGIKPLRLFFIYIFPQMRGAVLSAGALKTGRMILAFAGLSYLGLGPDPPAPELGRMIQESGIYMARAPWLMIAPGMAVTLLVLALNLAGDEGG